MISNLVPQSEAASMKKYLRPIKKEKLKEKA